MEVIFVLTCMSLLDMMDLRNQMRYKNISHCATKLQVYRVRLLTTSLHVSSTLGNKTSSILIRFSLGPLEMTLFSHEESVSVSISNKFNLIQSLTHGPGLYNYKYTPSSKQRFVLLGLKFWFGHVPLSPQSRSLFHVSMCMSCCYALGGLGLKLQTENTDEFLYGRCSKVEDVLTYQNIGTSQSATYVQKSFRFAKLKK